MSLNIGDEVPELELKDKNGELFSFKDLKGEQAFVVYFYPKDFTPGCTKEACSFRDRYEDFKDLGAEVIAISSDSEASHSKFSEKYKLPFIFLSDTEKEARKAFGVKSSFLGLVPGRETFVFDENGILRFRFNSMNATRHIPEALEALREISKN
ncbi:peroxiredoxin [Salegentibacter chungangensis]|uniref:thioredoxin-dependent peroxiredoxin n=1 Tax=Salegentibacter chungangensis TaxID=1335724 RepID=A0ABW3NQK3_9FLAO